MDSTRSSIAVVKEATVALGVAIGHTVPLAATHDPKNLARARSSAGVGSYFLWF